LLDDITLSNAIIHSMTTVLLIYFFLLGIIVGSFLNVVILRYNTGKGIKGRSMCMSCKTQLTWRELIPVLSFVFQKGRCKTCKTKLNIQYPLVELSTGILFALNFYFWLQNATSYTHLFFSLALTTCILALMIVIFVYDLRHKIIPDLFSFTAWGLSVVFIFTIAVIPAPVSTSAGSVGIQSYDSWIPAFSGMTAVQSVVLTHVLAGLFFYFIIWALWKLSKGRLIGLGDAKLLLTIGTMLGFVYGLSAIFISVWIGTLYAMYLLLKHYLDKRGKHITMKTEIPFGPFLIIGFLIVYFTHIDVTNVSLIFQNFS
jgi:prepilin signal peptidase PulO-like enzyme (type II secretory pathway)